MKNNHSKFFKVTVATTFAVSSVALVIPAASASTFSDVNPSQYFYNDVLNLQERGIIHGFPDGTFKPNSFLTRGQAAKIIAGVLGLNTVNVPNPNFKDIPTTHQYYGAIAALKQAGIIDGYPDGTYKQGELIERNHMAKILANAFQLTASEEVMLPFTDTRTDYYGFIAALYERGITTGKTPTTFDGESNVTRGQIAAFIARAETSASIPPDEDVVVDGNTITFTLSNYTNNTITIDDKVYRFSDAVRPIFTQANKPALANARITAVVENGTIQSVDSIILNRAGTASTSVVFDAKATIKDVTVNANYVTVKNLTVTNDATVTRKVTASVTFDGVTIQRDLLVDDEHATIASLNGVAQDTVGPTIYFTNSTAANIRVEVSGTKIITNGTIAKVTIAANVSHVDLNGNVTQVVIEGSSTVKLTGDVDIAELLLEAAAKLQLEIDGTIASLIVKDKEARITLGPNVKVTKLTIPSGTTAATIITNHADVKDQITTTVIGSSSGGGGGGSSSGGGSGGGSGGDGGSGGGNPPAETTADTVTFTFEQQSANISTIDVTHINGVTADTSAITVTTTDPFVITFDESTEISTGDVITIIVTSTDNSSETHTIEFDAATNKWIARRLQL